MSFKSLARELFSSTAGFGTVADQAPFFTSPLTYLAQAYLPRSRHEGASLTSHGDVKANIAKVRPARSAGGRLPNKL